MTGSCALNCFINIIYIIYIITIHRGLLKYPLIDALQCFPTKFNHNLADPSNRIDLQASGGTLYVICIICMEATLTQTTTKWQQKQAVAV